MRPWPSAPSSTRFDFDDHHRSKIHPGAAVLPAVLALGEPRDIDGETCLAALAAGYEVMARVSLAANPSSSRMRGWHLTGTCGTFGAAAAASVILGLDAPTTASALGLAGTQSAGPVGLQCRRRDEQAFPSRTIRSKRNHRGAARAEGLSGAAPDSRGRRRRVPRRDVGRHPSSRDRTRSRSRLADAGGVLQAVLPVAAAITRALTPPWT